MDKQLNNNNKFKNLSFLTKNDNNFSNNNHNNLSFLRNNLSFNKNLANKDDENDDYKGANALKLIQFYVTEIEDHYYIDGKYYFKTNLGIYKEESVNICDYQIFIEYAKVKKIDLKIIKNF